MKLAGAYINDDTYGRLVAMAAANNRTLAGECRHLFDRALRGELPVPDGPGTLPLPQEPIPQAVGLAGPGKPWQPSASMPQGRAQPPREGSRPEPLRAAPRVLAALKAGALPGSPANQQPAVNAALNPQPMAEAALPGYENVPVAGVGVVLVKPARAGMLLDTPGSTPATGLSCPAGCAGDAESGGCGCGGHDDACFFQTNPMPDTNPNHARPCLHATPGPLPRTAPKDAHDPRNSARRMPR